MNERNEDGPILDEDDLSDLGFSRADINSPLARPQGHTVARSYPYTPLERRGMITIYSTSEGGMKIIKKACEAPETGAERPNQKDLWGQLKGMAVPIGDVPVGRCIVPTGLDRVAAKQLADYFMAASEG